MGKVISTILILTDSNANVLGLQWYLLGLLAKEWEKRGIRVMTLHDLESSVSADVCLVHVDLSVVPSRYTEVASRYPHAINLHITDIRRSSYSRNRVMRGDGYEGPIIVKSSLNSAGAPERRGRPERRLRSVWERFNRELTRRAPASLPFQQPSITSKQHYRIFPKRRMLPVGWLDRDDIVVERFRPERHGDSFVLREWYFLGDREHYSCEISKDPVFTWGIHCPELVAPPPEAIRQLRSELRIDYGKIDYAVDCDGVPVLFDVNKTIGGFRNPTSERALKIAGDLADGIETILRTSYDVANVHHRAQYHPP
jgi:hypothetical protein